MSQGVMWKGTGGLQALLTSCLLNVGLGKQMGNSSPLQNCAEETGTAAQISVFIFLLRTPFFQSLLGL